MRPRSRIAFVLGGGADTTTHARTNRATVKIAQLLLAKHATNLARGRYGRHSRIDSPSNSIGTCLQKKVLKKWITTG
jgi:hypothetical protein